MKIFCFGNEFIENDSLAKTIIEDIQIENVEFIKCNSPEDIMDETDIVILDVVKDINKVILIDNPDQLKKDSIMSLHDFDLSYFLKLMDAMGTLNSLKIIGIPMSGNKELIKQEIIKIIKEF